MSDVQTWSTTAASNNSASPNGFPEGMAPSGVNDSAREIMAAVAKYRADTDGVNSTTGSANAYVLAASRTLTAYAQGDLFTFKSNFANTGSCTLNVDALGAQTIKNMRGAALAAGDIPSGAICTVVYDGTDFILTSLFPQAATATLSGIVELATAAEALAGTDTDRAVTAAGLAGDQTKANVGHTVLPGGILVNWARISFTAETGPVTENWTKAFSGTPYVAVNGRDLNVNAHVDLSTFTTTQIAATLSTAGTGTVYVIAVGPA